MSNKKELTNDELEKITGGDQTNNDCVFFVQALRKASNNDCDNCFYYNKNKNDEYECTHPLNK